MPKQFVKLFKDESLFQKTLQRNQKTCDSQFIVSNTEQYFLAIDQIEEHNNDTSKLKIKNQKFLLEPIGRNTAPAIALACFSLEREELVLVTPSDHLIKDEEAYFEAVQKAKVLARSGKLVTFGITPHYPETGFGYIESQGENVISFKEKPDAITAKQYLDMGNYYWNSGMFCFKAGIFLEELKKYSPEIYETSKKAFNNKASVSQNQLRITHEYMSAIPEDSIDYAVMEKSEKVKVIPSDIDWSDVGNFEALFEELPKDKNNNTLNDKHIAIGSKNNLIYGKERVITTIDLEDLIIVDTGDALLISKKGSSQKVKQIVSKLKKTTQLHNVHLTGNRPWGSYTVLEDSDGHKIKRIEVKPGGRLSLQKHKYRNEHWIVVSGTATVTINDDIFILSQNESTYIKAGDIHRLLNDTNEPLVIIEVQVGSYTGEDDIERLEDA